MLRERSEEEYEAASEGGVRQLFTLGPYQFRDTLDGEDGFHHFVLEPGAGGVEGAVYETDGDTMYELMARYLAGEYEKEAYRMERSPGHQALLDLLELATARARSGETDFSLEDLERGEVEVIDEDPLHEGEDEPR